MSRSAKDQLVGGGTFPHSLEAEYAVGAFLNSLVFCVLCVSPDPSIMERTSETQHRGWLSPKSVSGWPEARSTVPWIRAQGGLLAVTELPVSKAGQEEGFILLKSKCDTIT